MTNNLKQLLREAYNGNSECAYLADIQLGIGLSEDAVLAEAGIANIVPLLADNEILTVNLLFDYIMSRNNLRPFEVSNYCWELRGAHLIPVA